MRRCATIATLALSIMTIGAPPAIAQQTASQAEGMPAEFDGLGSRGGYGNRVGNRLNREVQTRLRNLTTRLRGGRTNELETPTIEANLARRR